MDIGDILGIRLSQMNTFLVVCRCGSFTTAAKQLYTTQSAVSKSILALERIVGFSLFDRHNNELILTASGRVLQEKWSGIVSLVGQSINEAVALAENGKRTIRVGLSDGMVSGMPYDGVFSKFMENRNDLNFLFLEFATGELVAKLVADEVDIILTLDYEVPTLEDLGKRWVPVADSPHLHVVMHESNPLAHRKGIVIDDLRDQALIVLDPTTHQTYNELVYSQCGRRGFEPKLSFMAPNVRSAVATMIRSHKGILLGNRFIYDGNEPTIKRVEITDTKSKLIAACGTAEDAVLDDLLQVLHAHYASENGACDEADS